MDVEESSEDSPDQMMQFQINIMNGVSKAELRKNFVELNIDKHVDDLVVITEKMYQVFRKYDAELLEINPLAVTPNGLIALDCKLVIDDSSVPRQLELTSVAASEPLTELEKNCARCWIKIY